MHPLANAAHLRLDISRPRGSFEVLSCKGDEPVNQPYCFELEIVSADGALDAHELLFGTAWLHANGAAQGIHGHIQSIVRSTTEAVSEPLPQAAPARYLITLGPRLGLMAYRQNLRVFQDIDARRIIVQLLSEHGMDDAAYLWQRQKPCVERDYCAQYGETDLQLLQRLCEEENIHYYFLHARSRHVVVFTDRPQASAMELVLGETTEHGNDALGKTGSPARRLSLQRGCLVGGLFETLRLDPKGRLKVRFDWGNQGDGARFNDCWIPVDPTLLQGDELWWGGMEVVVTFRDGNPNAPYITDRLADPDINPQAKSVVTPRKVLTTRIDTALFLDQSQQFVVDDEFIVRLSRNNDLHFRVGDSRVTIDSRSISLSGLKIMLTSIAQADGRDAGRRPGNADPNY